MKLYLANQSLRPLGRATCILMLAFCLALCAVPINTAWAEDDNTVKPNQLPDSSFLYDTDIAELAAADSFNDGQTVQIKGEAVGDAINDEDDASCYWVSIQDDDELNPSVISVLISDEQRKLIDSFGSYSYEGSEVQVQGTYHLSCADHQGLSDIHAEELVVLTEGKAIEHPLNPVIITAAGISVVLGLALFVVYSIRRERMR